MSFQQAHQQLQVIFQDHQFQEHVRANRKHAVKVVVERCREEGSIALSFPGYKAAIKNGRIIYDYRVDITKNGSTTALSHANIIVDIYNKIVYGKMSAVGLQEVLVELARTGEIDLAKVSTKLPYKSTVPMDILKWRVKQAHGRKKYNEKGNVFDWTLEELLKSLKWIVLQEDINYPMPRYEGRKMPFYRYLEAIFVAQHQTYTLEDVVRRTLSHTRPKLWKEVDYSFRKYIG